MNETATPTDQALATQHAQSFGLVNADTMTQMEDLAQRFFKSGLAPSKFENAQQIIITALFGRELGLSFQQSLTAVHVIEGVPSLHYKDILGLIRARCPLAKIKFLQQDTGGCRIEAWRPGEEQPSVFTFMKEDAQRAGLLAERGGQIIKDNWRNYPEDMMVGRAVGRMGRRLFSDILRGFGYTPDEISDAPRMKTEAPAPRATTSEGAAPIPKRAPKPKVEVEEAQLVGEPYKPSAFTEMLREHVANETGDDSLRAKPAAEADPEAVNRAAVLELVEALNLAENSNTADYTYGKWRDQGHNEATLVQGYMIQAKAATNRKTREAASASQPE